MTFRSKLELLAAIPHIKDAPKKEAIIENKIPNQYDAALHYIKKEGKSQGLVIKQK